MKKLFIGLSAFIVAALLTLCLAPTSTGSSDVYTGRYKTLTLSSDSVLVLEDQIDLLTTSHLS